MVLAVQELERASAMLRDVQAGAPIDLSGFTQSR
jgi:hypothetical protein